MKSLTPAKVLKDFPVLIEHVDTVLEIAAVFHDRIAKSGSCSFSVGLGAWFVGGPPLTPQKLPKGDRTSWVLALKSLKSLARPTGIEPVFPP
jgi:hypothetical protein